MLSLKKTKICSLLKGIETGDPAAAAVVNESKYIQHNPLTREGSTGLAELFKRLAKTSPRVDIIRVFEDGDFVFAHTDYDFNEVEVGFEVFRFEGDQVVEHWDNLQTKPTHPNPSGHTMLDGPTEPMDLHLTESNRNLVKTFVEEILIQNGLERLDLYIDAESFTEHNPSMKDGLDELRNALSDNAHSLDYQKIHRILAEGNFVLCVSEGFLNEKHVSLYDLFRITEGKIVEHWDTVDPVPPQHQWVNDNGKF